MKDRYRDFKASENHLFEKDCIKRRVRGAFGFRSIVLCITVVSVLVAGCLGRVAYIMIAKGEQYRQIAAENQLRDTVVSAVRGTIYDRNRTPLVTSVSTWNLSVNSYRLAVDFKKMPEEKQAFFTYLSEGISQILGLSAEKVLTFLEKDNSPDVRIRKNITADDRARLEEFFAKEYPLGDDAEKNVSPVDYFFYENDNVRLYPENNFASSLIGVVNADGDGETGIEGYYNEELRGEEGRILSARDSRGNEISTGYETLIDPVEGNGLVLTIDRNIQTYVENALTKALSSTKAKGVYAIVMDVDTGAVLAMSDKPDFDLNNPRVLSDNADMSRLEGLTPGTEEYSVKYSEMLFEQWNSFCITGNYEPGSTFKIFTLAAALEEGVATESTGHNCTSSIRIADTVYHCANHKAHGSQSLREGLMNSCNTFFISLGQKLGIENYYRYFELFGFTERTGIDASSESISIVHKKDKMSIVDLASTSFGQSVRITPLQLISGVCAIANGGKLMRPYLVAEVVDSEGNSLSVTEPEVKRQVISESTSETVRSMMESVVREGTGKNAYLEGYRIAGKTGTAQKLDSGSNTYIASFVALAPADDPEVAILVGVDSPQGYQTSGGALAAPLAKEVLASTLDYLGVEPLYTKEELERISTGTPSFIGKSLSEAESIAASCGLEVRCTGEGGTVVMQYPSEGQMLPDAGVILLYTDKAETVNEAVVPDFSGKTASEVNVIAAKNSLNIIFSGPTEQGACLAYGQDIAPGDTVVPGTTVTVYFANTESPPD